MHAISANGLRFAYLEEGEGPLVLLLHGFPDTAHTWDDLRPKIAAKGYRVVAPFMRGYRPTEIPARDADLETLARDALGLIDALAEKNEKKAIVIGHDWGAATAYGAAALGGDRVRKLLTLAIAHPTTVKPTLRKLWAVRHFAMYKLPGAARRFAADDFAALRAIYKRWSPAWTPSDEELAAVRECFADPASCDAAMGYYRALTFRPLPHLRERIGVPTVAFYGTGDPQLERADFENARRIFTGPYTIEAAPGAHFLHREHPKEIEERLLEHL
jgi:pimeloyl-ACP methyl ester carboxylesterase